MIKKYFLIIFLGIILLASALRLWQIGSVPPSPDWDEASLGYNAYSILHTGKDEYGKFLPVVIRSLDDYKPAFYMYVTVPSVAVLGLNVAAVRLPSAIFGILSVIAVFYLVRELFKDYKYKDELSLLASFFMAISPWSIQFSRVAFESNVGTSLNIFAALFFLKGLKKPALLPFSAIFAALSIYTYQSEKVFTPLLALVLVLVFRKALGKLNKKYLIGGVVTGFIFMLPMLWFLFFNSSSLSRLTSTSVFSSQTQVLQNSVMDLQNDKNNNDKLGLILDNRRIEYAKEILSGYISHFDLNWLFIT